MTAVASFCRKVSRGGGDGEGVGIAGSKDDTDPVRALGTCGGGE